MGEEHLEEVVADNLKWQDLKWGVDSVRVMTDNESAPEQKPLDITI